MKKNLFIQNTINLSQAPLTLVLCLLTSIFSLLTSYTDLYAQSGWWTWMKGDSTLNPSGIFGTMGMSSPLNKPSGTYGPHIWIDDADNLWIYGGLITDGANAAMWKYDPSINEWTWMSGSASTSISPVYGTQGIFSPSNTPGSRNYSGMAWVDEQGMFWLYGGLNLFAAKSDLWKYDPSINQWAWMSGSQSSSVSPVWNTYQGFDPANDPGSRYECSATWVDNAGHLWFYGGHDYGSLGYFNDMWQYDPAINEWAWMSGPNSANHPPSYGTKGIPSPNNTPGGRYAYSHWKQGNYFWLFGGDANSFLFADMWRYDILTNEWTWMSGSGTPNVSANAGSKCDSSQNYYPAARHESRASAGDSCGNFWLSGGQSGPPSYGTFNDLWVYQSSTNTWTWINGILTTNAAGQYNTQGVADPDNIPKSKFGSVMWRDSIGTLWLFGGSYLGGSNHTNDVWRYVPDPVCPSLITSCASTLLPSAFFQSGVTELCENSCTDFFDYSSGNPTSWQWEFPGGNPTSSTDQNPANICYTTAGIYDVTLIATNASGSDTLTLPSFITILMSPSALITQFGNTLSTVTAPSYQWSYNSSLIPGATNQDLEISQTGLYEVTVSDPNGCSASDTITVTFIPANAFAATDTLLCEKFCIDYTDQSTNNPTSWLWQFPGGVPSSSFDQHPSNICYDNPGIYDVTLITTNQFGTDTLTLFNYITVYPTPPFPVITLNGYLLTSSPAVGYQWQFNSINIAGATNQSYTATQTGFYTIVVEDSNGCVNSATLYVEITGVEDLFSDQHISIYPNPSDGYFIVECLHCEIADHVSIKMMNTLGQTVLISQEEVSTPAWKKEFNVTTLAPGIYFIEIFSEVSQGVFGRKKIIIEL